MLGWRLLPIIGSPPIAAITGRIATVGRPPAHPAICVIVPSERPAHSELYHYAPTLLRSPSPPQAPAALQNRDLARTQERSRHRRRPHRLSQTQARGLPIQLYPSRPLLCPPRNCPLRRHRLMVPRCSLVFPLRHSCLYHQVLRQSVPARLVRRRTGRHTPCRGP